MFNLFSLLILSLIGQSTRKASGSFILKEEAKYLALWEKRDLKARDVLIEHNLRLVAHIVKKFENTREDRDDLLSIGAFGLIKAVDTYNFKSNTKLATYAARCIENEILMHLRSNKKRKDTESARLKTGKATKFI